MHLEAARKLAAALGKCNTKARVGIPQRTVVVKETISEKARRIWRECEAIKP